MIIAAPSDPRDLKTDSKNADLIVVGGGLSGVCAAISAARFGLDVVLVQDRPVLGGNASSEVRLWILGATSHGGNNNRWAREGGILTELLLENQYRNPGGNPVIFDSILQDWVSREHRITLLVNTAVFHTETDANYIQKLYAFNAQNSTMYHLSSKLFVDSSGDGILTHLSGAAYRMGAEESQEFDEPMAPGDDYGKLLGHSLYFYSKNVGHPVTYVAPDFALKDIPALIPRYKSFKASEQGCSLWWIEWGGRLDTIHQSEEIKEELQKIVYGVWNYIKNSGNFPEAENLALEWVGTIPGKRESRRAEGDYMLCQRDIVEQKNYEDNVSHGGWSIDLHPADGVYGESGGCNQYHAKGIYGIPYRCMYSRNIKNLFINGRLLSASHVAFGSTRVMATSSAIGQAIGTAASVCRAHDVLPRDVLTAELMADLKCRLSEAGHYVPNYDALKNRNLATSATVSVSSELALSTLVHDAGWQNLSASFAQLLPQQTDDSQILTVPVKADCSTSLTVQIRLAEKPGNYTPDCVVAELEFSLSEGETTIDVPLKAQERQQYVFVCFMENEYVSVGLSSHLVSGLMTVRQGGLAKVSTQARQKAPASLGVESFDFWVPERRPQGKNIAFSSHVPVHKFAKENLLEGAFRPTVSPNAWVAHQEQSPAWMHFVWKIPIEAQDLILYFDCDYDHPLESVQYHHHDRVMPHLVDEFRILCNGEQVFETRSNHQGVVRVRLPEGLVIEDLKVLMTNTQGHAVSVFGVRILPPSQTKFNHTAGGV